MATVLSTAGEILEAVRAEGYWVWDRGSFEESGAWDLQVVGMRNPDSEPNRFDDCIAVVCRDDTGDLRHWVFKASVDPVSFWRHAPEGVSGKGSLRPGQYVKSHVAGELDGKPAWVQANPVSMMLPKAPQKHFAYTGRIDPRYTPKFENDVLHGIVPPTPVNGVWYNWELPDRRPFMVCAEQEERGMFGVSIQRSGFGSEEWKRRPAQPYIVRDIHGAVFEDWKKWNAGSQVIGDDSDYETFWGLTQKQVEVRGWNRLTYTLLHGVTAK